MSRPVTVHEVLYDGAAVGPAGDGTLTRRFRDKKEAEAFAATNTCWGRPAKVTTSEVSRRLAARWGLV